MPSTTTSRWGEDGEVPHADDGASAPLWAVYIAEADKYDKSLVESWRADMEGMLIFAGLFSASLTAFLIESYKTLTPDMGDTTVALLTQISRQLALSASGENFTLTTVPQFTPAASSLVCNVFWFTSLGLSLMCALVATLLEQWSRDFLHRADRRSAPIIRARAFSYLYYGLKRFKMHHVVEIIPLLLHTSLLFFFAGLVAFLIPVNRAMVIVTSSLLAIIATLYFVLTILPLLYLDAPYRTPLSGAFWSLRRLLNAEWNRLVRGPKHRDTASRYNAESMVEAMFRQATMPTVERSTRDQQALIWTAKSLSDDMELEPMVEALPDVLWGPEARRQGYDGHVHCLVQHPEVKLLDRIEGLLHRSPGAMLIPEARKRREIACYKALWAISTLPRRIHRTVTLHHPHFEPKDLDVRRHYIPCRSMVHWRWLNSVYQRFQDLSRQLVDDTTRGQLPDFQSVMMQMRHESTVPHASLGDWAEFTTPKEELDAYTRNPTPESASVVLGMLVNSMGMFHNVVSLEILSRYVADCWTDQSNPYRFLETLEIIESGMETGPTSSGLLLCVERSLDTIVVGVLDNVGTTREVHWIDIAIRSLLRYWYPYESGDEAPTLPRAVIHLLNSQWSQIGDLKYVLSTLPAHALSCVPATIRGGVTRLDPHDDAIPVPVDECLAAIWQLYKYWGLKLNDADPSVHRSILDALVKHESSSVYASLRAFIRHAILCRFSDKRTIAPLETLNWLSEIRLFPALGTPRPMSIPEGSVASYESSGLTRLYDQRIGEYLLEVLTDFLEACLSTKKPFKAAETITSIGSFYPPVGIQHTSQLRFSSAVKNVCGLDWDTPTVIHAIVTLTVFRGYLSPPLPPGAKIATNRWLDNSEAREDLRNTFTNCMGTIDPRLRQRSHIIVAHLEGVSPLELSEDKE
ncbi:hypothetical protein FB451DRAFT_1360635 [Mycena latifolia]|nr:hypothetical protein FB451DRAFT_1360635 [Mycena latifolia]